MHLRRVEVHGFKSFADRQRFEFGPGIVAIVGPNGSGKSNVSDAVRWALGEQTVRAIRARKTEDVIFSGSEKRRPQGMAEVTLTLDNTEGWMPVDFSEVTVTRRAYRSGENEYLINGQKVRLLDVQDLFRRAQVGQNSYAMMTQGLVDEVLAMRPQERRELIEEAASVAQYRVELSRAERRLTETRDNLGHVRMLIRELEPRLRQLERQSTRARRYRELEHELIDALCVLLTHEHRAAREAIAAAQAVHDQRAVAFRAAQEQVQVLDARVVGVTDRVAAQRAALEAAQRAERQHSEEVLRLEQGVALAEQRMQLLAARRVEIERELANIELPPEIATGGPDEEIATLEAAVVGAAGDLTRAREALASADEASRAMLREMSGVEGERGRLDAERALLERRSTDLDARLVRQATARAAAGRDRAELRDALRAYGVRVLHARTAREQATAALRDRRERRIQAERDAEQSAQHLDHARRAMTEASDARQQVQTRIALLQALAEQAAGAAGGAAAALLAAGDGAASGGVIGIVSSLIRVPDGLDAAIGAALAEFASAVVVNDTSSALQALTYLQAEEAGQTSVFPLDAITHQYPLNLFAEPGVIGIAARLVTTEAPYRALVDTLLGRVIVVEDVETAQRMLQRGLGAAVTRDGVLFRVGGDLFGGRERGRSEQAQAARELVTLETRLEAADLVHATATAELARCEAAVAAAREALQAVRRAVDAAEVQQRAAEQSFARERASLSPIASRMRAAQQALRSDDDAVHLELLATRERLNVIAADRSAVEQALAALQARAQAVATEREVAAAHASEATRALALAESARDVALQQRAAVSERRRRALAQIDERRTLLATVRREAEDIELTLQGTRATLAQARTALGDARDTVAPAHAALADLEQQERELQASRADEQAQLFAAERELLASESAVREAAAYLQQLQQQITDEGLALGPHGAVERMARADAPAAALADTADGVEAIDAAAPSVVPIAGGAEVDAVEMRERIAAMRQAIRDLGPVNLEAIDDLSSERERHDFLSAQVHDLEQAEAQLRDAIRVLEQQIRVRFDETFAVVNQAFGEYFTRFFGGGHATMNVIRPEDGGELGVEVTAQPPGKRISSLTQLSGGERSMTSVALLFALLAVNPAPVCVLDEVDAALDEANVGRFADTLRELATRSQFIVITHNRRTIENADAIYGVSMGDESTSTVLSLRVNELARAS